MKMRKICLIHQLYYYDYFMQCGSWKTTCLHGSYQVLMYLSLKYHNNPYVHAYYILTLGELKLLTIGINDTCTSPLLPSPKYSP